MARDFMQCYLFEADEERMVPETRYKDDIKS